MGAIRVTLLIFLSILFFVLILIGGMIFTIASSLQYDNIKKEIALVIGNVSEEFGLKLDEKLNETLPLIERYCQENSEYVFSYADYTITIPCEILNDGPEAIIDYGIDNAIRQVYYKEYECNFWACFQEGELPLFLISEKAHNYWNNKFYLVLMVSVILIVLMFFLVEKKTNLPIIVGSLMIVVSVIILKIGNIISIFLSQTFLKFLTIFFTISYSVFLKFLISGIVLIAIGILLKIFGTRFKKSKEIKEKISENKNKKSK